MGEKRVWTIGSAAQHLAWSLHTDLRKAVDSRESTVAWSAARMLQNDELGYFVRRLAQMMKTMGWAEAWRRTCATLGEETPSKRMQGFQEEPLVPEVDHSACFVLGHCFNGLQDDEVMVLLVSEHDADTEAWQFLKKHDDVMYLDSRKQYQARAQRSQAGHA